MAVYAEAVTYELGTAPYEGQELKVIEPPHALTPRWLHAVRLLQLPHHTQIPGPITAHRSICKGTQHVGFVLPANRNAQNIYCVNDG